MEEAGQQRLSDYWKRALDTPITIEEIKGAMQKGEVRKAQGKCGRRLEFFSHLGCPARRHAIPLHSDIRQRYCHETTETLVIVCIPKAARPCQLTDYRQITLLITDYKIMARIVAVRIRTVL
jgi:hypothetical protein